MLGKCRLFSPPQHMTGGHTAPPTAEVPTGDTHGGTRTPAALVGALRVAGLILPLCGGETGVTLSVHVTGQHRPTAGNSPQSAGGALLRTLTLCWLDLRRRLHWSRRR